MAAQPLLIIASARQNSSTRRFLQIVFQQTPHQELDLLEYTVGHYRYENDYPATDNFLKVIDQVLRHEVVVFATPVYWYAMSGLLKTFLDRFTDLITVHKQKGRQLEGKTIFLLAVGADPELPDGFEVPFKLTAKYLGMRYGGSLYASTEEVETDIFHAGDHREFLRDIAEAQKEAS